MTEEKRDFSARFSFCLQSPQTAKIALKQIGVNYRRGLICRTILNGFFLSALWFWLLNRIQVSLQNSDFLMNVLRPFCFDIHWKRGSTDRTPFKKASLLHNNTLHRKRVSQISLPFFVFSQNDRWVFLVSLCAHCARVSLSFPRDCAISHPFFPISPPIFLPTLSLPIQNTIRWNWGRHIVAICCCCCCACEPSLSQFTHWLCNVVVMGKIRHTTDSRYTYVRKEGQELKSRRKSRDF